MTISPLRGLSYPQAIRNERLNAADVLLAGPFIVMVTQFAPVLITRLGAAPLLIGAFTSGSALVGALMAALGPRWIERFPEFRTAMGIPGLIWRCVMFLFPLALLLPVHQSETIVVGTIVLSFAAGLSNYTFPAFLPRMTLPDRLARLVSLRWTMIGVSIGVSTPILAWLLDALAMPLNYFVACGIAFVMVCGSLVSLMLVKPAPPSAHPHARKALSGAELRKSPRSVRYLLCGLVIHSAINAAGPLSTLRLVRELNITDAQLGIFYAIFWFSLAVVGLFMSRIVDRLGNLTTFVIAMAGLGVQLALLAIAPNLLVVYLTALISGIMSVAFQVSIYGLMVEFAPPDRYEGFSGWNTIVLNISIFAAPLIMSGLVGGGIPVAAGLIACAVLRLVAGGLSLVALRPVGNQAV